MKPLWILYVQMLWLSYWLPITTQSHPFQQTLIHPHHDRSKPVEHFSYCHPTQTQTHIQAYYRYDLWRNIAVFIKTRNMFNISHFLLCKSRTERADLFIVCCRSATDVPADLQTMCRSSAECLQNICRASVATICNKSANLQTLCRRNQPIMLNKEPTKCTNQTKFI